MGGRSRELRRIAARQPAGADQTCVTVRLALTAPRRTPRANRLVLTLLVVLVPLGLAACTPAMTPRIHATATLGAADVVTHDHYDQYSYRPALGSCPYGADTERSVPAGTLLVGWDNSFDAGSQPFPCISKLDYAYRGGVRFDLSELQGFAGIIIETATLSWQIDSAIVRDASGNPTGAANCVGALMESTQSIFTQGAFLPALPYQGGQGDVTGLVQSWVMNGDPNFGFVLVGLNESYNRTNAACVNVLSHFTLTITYSRR